MNVVFHRVHGQYFRSFESFELTLDSGQTLMVQGKLVGDADSIESNGSGKSSIFSAIAWALFNKFPHISGRDVSGDDVIMRGHSSCQVTVNFSINDDQYTVVRFRQHPDFKNKVRFFRNDAEITPATNSSTQQLIEETLGISFELFAQLVFLTETSMRNSFTFETDAKRKQILVHVLPRLNEFNIARDRAKQMLSSYSSYREQLLREIETLQKTLVALPNVDSNVEEAQALQRKIAAANILKSQKLEAFREINEERGTYKLSIDVLTPDLEKHEKMAMDAREELLVHHKLLSGYESQYRSLKTTLERWQPTAGICQSCQQVISPELRQKQMDVLTIQIADAIRIMRRSQEDVKFWENRCKELDQQVRQLKSRIVEHAERLRALDTEQAQLTRDVSFIDESIASATASITNMQQTIEQVHKARTQLQEKLQIASILEETCNSYVEPCKIWVDGYGPKGVVTIALDHVLELLTMQTNKWLRNLWHVGAAVKFSMPQDDTTKIGAMFILDGREVNLYTLSSGQARRMCLAICFGLRETLIGLSGWRSNLLVLDEVFDGLDNAGRLTVLYQIQEIEDTTKFIITQFPHYRGPIDDMITVQYAQGKSKIIRE